MSNGLFNSSASEKCDRSLIRAPRSLDEPHVAMWAVMVSRIKLRTLRFCELRHPRSNKRQKVCSALLAIPLAAKYWLWVTVAVLSFEEA